MTTGQRIKKARKKAGLTQKDLGEKLGISFQGVAQWENDLRNPKRETLQRIASALGVSVAYLLGWDEAVSALEAAGMSVEDISEEMNIPVDRIVEIINSQEIYSSEAAEKIIRVASLLANEAKKVAAQNEIRGSIALEQKLAHIGYSIGYYEEDAELWINYPDGTLTVTEADLKALNESADSYLRFKLEELKEAHKDKFRPK